MARPGTFAPGQSGNPGGRPKDAFGPVLRAFLEAKDAKGGIRRNRIVTAVYNAAIDGDMKAVAILLDRAYGKVAQPLDHAGPGGGPIVLQWQAADE